MNQLAVFSDLHIKDEADPLYGRLLRYLQSISTQNKQVTLVFAGDIFDLFVGNKALFKVRFGEFLKQVELLGQQGVKIYYIEGNHDFLLKNTYKNVEVNPKEVKLRLDNKTFLILHGDTVDTDDYGYRALRMAFRSPFMKAFVHFSPDHWIDRFGKWSSAKSRDQERIASPVGVMSHRELLRKKFRSYACDRMLEGVDFVVMGHCHDLDQMAFQIEGRQCHYMNVGYPPLHGSFVIWETGETKLSRSAF